MSYADQFPTFMNSAPQDDKKVLAEHTRGFDTTAEEAACSKVKQHK